MIDDIDILALLAAPEAASPDQKAIDWLRERGVGMTAIASPWSVMVARVVFDARGGYEPSAVGDFAYVLPVIENGIIDAVAWSPVLGKTATRLGFGACLGEGQIGRDGFGTTGIAIPVWRSPLDWLRAKRTGIVIVDAQLAAHRLAGFTLQAEDRRHRDELRRLLRVPDPTIVLPTAARIAA